ncbi:pectate lyase family protein [Maribellus mangrovi]|uniref:pectate lyase family protein n=1 Tax=Maribellus mangrovi TaxID=3133146 RepID=UPI0030EC4C6A
MRLLIFLFFSFSVGFTMAQTPAFPGAEGGGMYVTGGRGGKVIFVDNLNNKGKGSFRKAIEAEGPRTIIFRVSGNIELEKTIHIKNGHLTIAGQTAPGDGICLKNYGIRVDADNVIIRYIRVRPGDKAQDENDAIYGLRRKDIIIDHCSLSWADDEVASFYDNENFTLQWCILSESMYDSYHHKGTHGYGGIWGGLNASFHHNLISDHSSRNPRFCGSRYSNNPESEKTDFRNNVIYNWGFNSAYGGEEGYYNMVNNYYKPGPATKKDVRDRILNLTQTFFNENYNTDTLGAGWFYIDGNVVEGYPQVSADNWNGGVQGKGVNEKTKKYSRLDTPIEHAAVNTSDAETAYQQVLKSAGANFVRDDVDKRIIEEAASGVEKFGASYGGGGLGIIDSPKDVGGWPELKSTVPPTDSDNDGMPDSWEEKHQLNPQKKDNNGYNIDKSYTNLEVYINALVNQ